MPSDHQITVAVTAATGTIGLGLLPPLLTEPSGAARAEISLAARVPPVVPALSSVQLPRHPLELDATRVRQKLGWKPDFNSTAAVQSTRSALGL